MGDYLQVVLGDRRLPWGTGGCPGGQEAALDTWGLVLAPSTCTVALEQKVAVLQVQCENQCKNWGRWWRKPTLRITLIPSERGASLVAQW